MNKYKKTEICGLPTVEELRSKLNAGEQSPARVRLQRLYDYGTFVETNAYVKRGFSDFLSTEQANELEGVICGYGAIDGKLVFAFAEDSSRMGGVIDERHAKKICDLYKLAISNGAPVIGIFDSKGTDVFQGTAGLASYGKILSCVAKASGKIAQIAYIAGKCIGTAATIASMFDFAIKLDGADFYVNSVVGKDSADTASSVISDSGDEEYCTAFIRRLISFIPDNSYIGTIVNESTDNLNKKLGELDFAGDAHSAISAIADNGVSYEICRNYAPAAVTALATIGGVKCGIVATSFSVNEGKISSSAAKKIVKFIKYCDAFALPIVTLADSAGIDAETDVTSSLASDLAALAFAYTYATTPKITVIIGHSIGASFVLLGSKALGADLVYATDNAEIGALIAESGVAFAWDKYITLEKTREELVNEWKNEVSSPARAAASGEIDDIISINELRARICSALLMLSSKCDLNKYNTKITH